MGEKGERECASSGSFCRGLLSAKSKTAYLTSAQFVQDMRLFETDCAAMRMGCEEAWRGRGSRAGRESFGLRARLKIGRSEIWELRGQR
eukprot:3448933-Rhodomonas_salina.1